VLKQFQLKPDAQIAHNSIYSLLSLFDQLDQASAQQLEQYQWRSLKKILRHAKSASRFYKKSLPETLPETHADFRQTIPILTRFDLQHSLSDIKATQLPNGIKIVGKVFSSGTTGVPVEVYQSNFSQLWFRACHLRDLAWCHWDIRNKLASIKYFPGMPEMKPGKHYLHWDSWIDTLFYTGQSAGLDIHADIEYQVQWLQDFNPDYLITYPSNLEALLDSNCLKYLPNLKSIKTLSEPLFPEVKQAAEDYATLFNTYSAQELGYVASQCHLGNFHLQSEVNYVEILRDDGTACEIGETGRVVVTNLVNHGSPIIRYELGDRAAFGIACPCGLPHPVLQQVDGKQHPLFLLDNGQRKNSIALAVSIRKLNCAKQFQIVQSTTGLLVNIVPGDTWNETSISQIQLQIDNFFERSTRFQLHLVNKLDLYAGKRRHMICEL
jgi:phenylacetate-CoA ligase